MGDPFGSHDFRPVDLRPPDSRPVKTTIYRTLAPSKRRYTGLSPRVSCTKGTPTVVLFCFVFSGITVLPVHREMFQHGMNTENVFGRIKIHGLCPDNQKVTQRMEYTVNMWVDTETRCRGGNGGGGHVEPFSGHGEVEKNSQRARILARTLEETRQKGLIQPARVGRSSQRTSRSTPS